MRLKRKYRNLLILILTVIIVIWLAGLGIQRHNTAVQARTQSSIRATQQKQRRRKSRLPKNSGPSTGGPRLKRSRTRTLRNTPTSGCGSTLRSSGFISVVGTSCSTPCTVRPVAMPHRRQLVLTTFRGSAARTFITSLPARVLIIGSPGRTTVSICSTVFPLVSPVITS